MILADDIVEFHASRILLLILICGTRDNNLKLTKLNGLTKLAKLDFFIRYPSLFERVPNSNNDIKKNNTVIESKMIRFHYGPWDHRYYQVLPFLESRNLLKIEKDPNRNSYLFLLTEEGKQLALDIKNDPNFKQLVDNITTVDDVLGDYSGNQLKILVYDLFKEEVADKMLGEVIEP